MARAVRTSLLLALPLLAAAGLWWRWPRIAVDLGAVPAVATPAWSTDGPAVLVDDGHLNPFTTTAGLAPLAALLRADGYRVLADDNAGRAEVLRRPRVAIVAGALGPSGVMQSVLSGTGLERLTPLEGDAMLGSEVATLEAWVRNGGALLIAGDAGPAAGAMASLTARFGVTLSRGIVVDPSRSVDGHPSRLVFTRAAGLPAAHPVLDGESAAVRVDRVVTDGGPALTPGPDATVLLQLGPSAVELASVEAPVAEGQPVAARAHAVALPWGRGRVVVLADAGLLTTELGADGRAGGLAAPDAGNVTFVRNILFWLASGR